jgi:hypothetical protein
MRLNWTLLTFPALASSAFVPQNQKNDARLVRNPSGAFLPRPGSCLFSTASPGQSEAERLMQRARELRESAVQDEYKVHLESAQKKAQKDAKTDKLIHGLFFEEDGLTLVDRLHKKNPSIDTLERVVDRLDEREIIAEGKEHVTLVEKDGKVTFERVSLKDDQEHARVLGKIEELIEGVTVLDAEFRSKKNNEADPYVTHTEDQHWGSDKRADRLTNRAHEIRRGREEQFQKRLEEFYEAQRIKKDQPAPPKAKDDHGFIP